MKKTRKLLSKKLLRSQFDDFYTSHEEFYDKITDYTENKVSEVNGIESLIDYYGYGESAYNLIIVPLYGGGYGVRIPIEDNKIINYAIIPPVHTPENLLGMLWHEFNHSYVNPLTKENMSKVRQYSDLYTPIKEQMTSQQYSTWESCVNEHMVRAIVARLTLHAYGEEQALKELSRNEEWGFIYIKQLYDKLEEYENNRETYKNMKQFYPELVGSLKFIDK